LFFVSSSESQGGAVAETVTNPNSLAGRRGNLPAGIFLNSPARFPEVPLFSTARGAGDNSRTRKLFSWHDRFH